MSSFLGLGVDCSQTDVLFACRIPPPFDSLKRDSAYQMRRDEHRTGAVLFSFARSLTDLSPHSLR